MKRLPYILFLIFYLTSVFANDVVEYPLESLPKVHTPLSPDYSYFTLGSSGLLQQIGIGRRYKSFETLKGHDIGLNAYCYLPILAVPHGFRYPVYPSIKYSYLIYKNNSPDSPYFGIACEGALAIDRSLYFFPNIGLIWGTERENIRFTQLQLNVIPVIGLVVGTGLLLFGSDKGFIPDRDAGMLIALGSASVLCTYSAGF